MDELRASVKKIAQESGMSEIQTITNLQSAAALTGNNELMEMLCELKWEYV